MSSAICLNLDQSKILSSGNGLNVVGKEDWLSALFFFSRNVFLKVLFTRVIKVQDFVVKGITTLGVHKRSSHKSNGKYEVLFCLHSPLNSTSGVDFEGPMTVIIIKLMDMD